MTKMMLLFFLFCTSNLSASEVDNFTNRNAPLDDATVVINQAANRLIDEAVVWANAKGECREDRLLRAVSKRFKNHYLDKFARFVHKDPSVPRRHIKIKDSIYRDFTMLDSYVLGFVGPIWDSTASVIKMGPYQFGTDKWEHFFGRGFSYYRRHVLEGQSLEKVLKYGLKSERSILGAMMTGVMSYGDMSANFKGMHFFNHLFGKGKDYLEFSSRPGPYVTCVDKKWKRTQEIDLLVYVDDSWDEAINCSRFRNKKMLKKVTVQLSTLRNVSGQADVCPVEPEKLQALQDYFGDYAPYVLNDRGHAIKD